MTKTLVSSLTTPLTPPTTEEDRLSWLRLYRSRRVGVSTFFRLLSEHATAQQALEALPEVARAAGSGDYEPATRANAETEFRRARDARAELVCFGDERYPKLLKCINDPPPLFWAIGNMELLDTSVIAMVGARNASSLGERFARKLASELGEAGFVVASGLARGIDAAVHDAALPSGTIAVLGGGVDVTYPRENADLQRNIARGGLLISEQPMGLAPQARHFPRRNRIISGLARGLVVVEAAARSGSLITARNALDQGRDVLAVPGHPFDGRASGCNNLIRDGAALVRGVDDILDVVGAPDAAYEPGSNMLPEEKIDAEPTTSQPHLRSNPQDPPTEKDRPTAAAGNAALSPESILALLSPSPVSEDQLIRDLGRPVRIVAPILTDLELDGRVHRHPGGMISRSVG